MALDSNLAVRWVYGKLAGDATLTGLLGASGRVYRGLGPGEGYPYIVVGIQSVGEREGAVRSGPNTHSATPLQIRTSVWDTDNFDRIEQIAARIDVLLDGQTHQAVTGGEMIVCTRGTDQERLPADPNNPVYGWDIFWDMAALAS